MNGLRRGPELKLPDVRVPKFLEDLYFDLRDRRLLPLVALALVAIVAVPILLSGGGKETPGPTAPAAGSNPVPASQAASLTVVRANPGLRDYRKRLRGRKPTDPFKQRFTAPDLKGAKLGSKGNNGFEAPQPVTTSTSTSTTITSTDSSETIKTTRSENGAVTTTTETHPHHPRPPEAEAPAKASQPGGAGGESTDGAATQGSETPVSAFSIDVRIEKTVPTSDGGTEKGAPIVKKGVMPPAALPGEKDQVVTYVGIDSESKEPMLLVSDEVISVFGEADCLAGTGECRLLAVEPEMPVTLVVGPNQVRYKVTVLKMEAVPATR
jgi:hypothetical protein